MHTTHDITLYFLSKAAKQEVHNWGEKKKGQEQLPDSFLRILNESVPSCSHPSCLL